MTDTPAFLDAGRPDVPDLVVAHGVTPFHLPHQPVRGRLVRLGPLAEALLARHDRHPAVNRLCGEALALAAVLASALKFRGSFSVQAKGDGPVGMLVADCTHDGALRGCARLDARALAALLAEEAVPSARQLLGVGSMAFTVDQGSGMERHQGIVSLAGDSLADAALHYFAASEQFPVWLRLACAHGPAGWRASALVLERIGVGGIDPELSAVAQGESWRTATVLAETVSDAELLDDALAPERLLFNLFHSEGVAADRPRALAYGCRCSRQRLSGILEGFTSEDLDHMAVDGDIVMTCEFCNFDFRFVRAEVRGGGSAGPAADLGPEAGG